LIGSALIKIPCSDHFEAEQGRHDLFSNALLFPISKDSQQEKKQVDKVEIEGQGA
jgi:hypothetical protein